VIGTLSAARQPECGFGRRKSLSIPQRDAGDRVVQRVTVSTRKWAVVRYRASEVAARCQRRRIHRRSQHYPDIGRPSVGMGHTNFIQDGAAGLSSVARRTAEGGCSCTSASGLFSCMLQIRSASWAVVDASQLGRLSFSFGPYSVAARESRRGILEV
jgi:hypothetical protein